MQNIAEVHVRPASSELLVLLGDESTSIAQVLPFQFSASPTCPFSVSYCPTAPQLLAEPQETPSNCGERASDGSDGADSIDHDDPFHPSANVPLVSPEYPPTAVHELAPLQVIDVNTVSGMPPALNAPETCQEIPFQVSASVRYTSPR
jgi:hypothetical protein